MRISPLLTGSEVAAPTRSFEDFIRSAPQVAERFVAAIPVPPPAPVVPKPQNGDKLVPAGEFFVSDWIAQGENMQQAASELPVTMRVVRREMYKPAIQVMRPSDGLTYCWLSPTQCTTLVPLLESGTARIEAKWMRAGSASGVRLALLIRVALDATKLDSITGQIIPKDALEAAAWASLASLTKTSLSLSAPLKMSNSATDVLDLRSSRASSSTTTTTLSSSLSSSNNMDVSSKTDTAVEPMPSELKNLLDGNVARSLPVAEPPAQLLCTLHDHQKTGLGWMLQRESEAGETSVSRASSSSSGADGKKTKTDADDLPAGWEKRVHPETKKPYYVNLATGTAYSQHPSSRNIARPVADVKEEAGSACGGILADDMGLGKTVQMISLILAARPPAGKGPRATLVVCPLSVLPQWQAELSRKVAPGALKVAVFHGPNRASDPSELEGVDVVLTTYATLALEGGGGAGNETEAVSSKAASKKRSRTSRVLLEVEWFRIILDEAHTIKDRTTRTAKSCFELRGGRRWAISGTPISNKLEDLFSLLHFVQLEPYGRLPWWTHNIMRPIKAKDERGMERLKAILGQVLLRRTKDQSASDGTKLISLPPRQVNVEAVQFSPSERQIYDKLYAQARMHVMSMIKDNSVMDGYAHILLMLLRLRQCCDHPLLVEGSNNNKAKLLECMECFEAAPSSMHTPCEHLLCQPCLQKALQRGECSICNAAITALQCRPSSPTKETSKDEEHFAPEAPFFHSAKTQALISRLVEVGFQEKSIVFSQWTSMLDIIGEALRRANIPYLRLDGSMNSAARQQAIERFNNDNVPVFLISVKAGGLGLNLTAASRAYVMDPWWCPTVESQALDRLYRIGQQRQVVVTRFIVQDTIEEAIMTLQRSKEEMVARVLEPRLKKDLRVDELKTLFSL